jgi:oligopeptide/dipeptide ABC transporter ATP-binding protein
MSNILEVKNLKVSFRTNSGTVKAVRNISFNLEKGETLAIVGESGSGKSVTSKAILGILAGNSIVESGEIFYNGMDLLKISEEEMCKIRGDKISMIFQDPLSSLDPIVKIGRQITEAMLLKNKLSRKMGRIEFNSMLAILKANMIEAIADESVNAEIADLITTFDKFNIQAIEFETSYNNAFTHAEELLGDIADYLFLISKKQKVDVKAMLTEVANSLKDIRDPFLTSEYDADIDAFAEEIRNLKAEYTAPKNTDGIVAAVPENIVNTLERLDEFLKKLTSGTLPNFFRIGYYKYKNPEAVLNGKDIEGLNEMALAFLQEDFMNRFIELEKAAIINSFNKSLDGKKKLLPMLADAKQFFENDFTKAEANAKINELVAVLEESIDKLQFNKDSIAYTFKNALTAAVNKYFTSIVNNAKEEKRFAKQSAKREALIAKGKQVDWKVVPMAIFEVDELKENITLVIDRLANKYEADIAAAADVDFDKMSIALIDFFKDKASQVVYRVTKKLAKEKAIKLMEEVGIPEPRIRYNQYPFEFSGGMRQRIVIAIALAANPDILICDEPTTALDVTIQAQILELINKLKKERNLSVIFITHDLGVVANMADKIAVMYAGKIVEIGTSEDIFYNPRHPYTWALLSSMPDLDTNEKLEAIPGTPPNMIYPPKGDAFAARNKYALKIDFEEQPPMFKVSDTHYAATWLLHPDAPQVEIPKIIRDRIERMHAKGGNADA